MMIREGRKKTDMKAILAMVGVVILMMMNLVGMAEAWTFETLKEEYVEKNKWVLCAKTGWSNCMHDMGGYNLISGVICPYTIYWECEYAWRIGRRPVDKNDPYWNDHCCDPQQQPAKNSTIPSRQ